MIFDPPAGGLKTEQEICYKNSLHLHLRLVFPFFKLNPRINLKMVLSNIRQQEQNLLFRNQNIP